MTSLGNPSAKKQTTSHTPGVSSGEESITSGEMIDQLHQPDADDNSSAGLLQEVEQFYSGEDSGSKVNEKLVSVTGKLIQKKTSQGKLTVSSGLSIFQNSRAPR